MNGRNYLHNLIIVRLVDGLGPAAREPGAIAKERLGSIDRRRFQRMATHRKNQILARMLLEDAPEPASPILDSDPGA